VPDTIRAALAQRVAVGAAANVGSDTAADRRPDTTTDGRTDTAAGYSDTCPISGRRVGGPGCGQRRSLSDGLTAGL
jgi:hypothetical protein